MTTHAIKSVVVVGSGLQAWLTAAVLSRSYQAAGIQVTLVEEQDTMDRVNTLHPDNLRILNHLETNEKEMLAKVGSLFTIGSQFRGWSTDDYFQPLGTHGGPMDYVSFQHFAIKRQQQKPTRYDSYSLATAVANANKFAHPQVAPDTILSTLVYAMTIESSAWKEQLKSAPFTVINASVNDVQMAENDKTITSLDLSDGQTLSADLYLDCTASKRSLISKLSGYEYSSLQDDFKVNRIARLTRPSDSALNHSEILADEHGWLRNDYSQTQVSSAYHFNADSITDDEVQIKLNDLLDLEADSQWFVKPFEPGIVRTPWLGNCVALGSTQASLESIDSSPLHGMIVNLLRFMTLFPRSANWQGQQFEFNRKTNWWYDNQKEMNICRYMGLDKSHPLAISKQAEVPESLARKLALFCNNGQMAYYEEEPFHAPYRVALLLGMGFTPEKYDPLLDNFSFDGLEQRFDRMKVMIRQTTEQMPGHSQYIEQFVTQ